MLKTKKQLEKALANGPVKISNIDLTKVGLYFDQLTESKETRIENGFLVSVSWYESKR